MHVAYGVKSGLPYLWINGVEATTRGGTGGTGLLAEAGRIILGDDPDWMQNGTAVVGTRFAGIQVWDALLSSAEINSLSASAVGLYANLYSSGTIQAQHGSFFSLDGNLTGDVTGNLTGNVTGDLTGDVTGDVTGNVTGDLTGNLVPSRTITWSNQSTYWRGTFSSALPSSDYFVQVVISPNTTPSAAVSTICYSRTTTHIDIQAHTSAGALYMGVSGEYIDTLVIGSCGRVVAADRHVIS